LAQVTVNTDGSIAQIDNCVCRRLVVSLSTAWWHCTGTSTSGVDVTNKPVQVTADGKNPATVTVTGNNNLEIGANVTYSFGSGITVTQPTSANPQPPLSSVVLSVIAQPNASLGLYNLTIVNPDCSVVIVGGALNVGASTPSSAAAKSGSAPSPPSGLKTASGQARAVSQKLATARAARARQAPEKPPGA